jgi:chromosome segregation ATPase
LSANRTELEVEINDLRTQLESKNSNEAFEESAKIKSMKIVMKEYEASIQEQESIIEDLRKELSETSQVLEREKNSQLQNRKETELVTEINNLKNEKETVFKELCDSRASFMVRIDYLESELDYLLTENQSELFRNIQELKSELKLAQDKLQEVQADKNLLEVKVELIPREVEQNPNSERDDCVDVEKQTENVDMQAKIQSYEIKIESYEELIAESGSIFNGISKGLEHWNR